MQIKSLLLAIFCCLSVQAFSQTLCVHTGTPGSTSGIVTSDFAQSITMGGGCTGEFAGLSIASSSTIVDASPVWQLDIYQGDGFGGTLQYSQTGIALTQLGSYLFIKISGGSGSKAFTAGNQYTFRVSTTSPTNTLTAFRNTTSFYAGGQGYSNGAPISATGGDFRVIGVYTKSATPSCGAATRLYVKHNASGSNNGTSWANAYTSLQSAIDYASGCSNIQEIWVAAGTYKPSVDASGNASPASANTKTFQIDFPVALYGGFAGTETLLSQRNVASNQTILSGDIDNNDTANPAVTASDIQGTNAHAVVYIKNVEAGVTIDGFTVTAGKLAYGYPGGGIGNDGIGFPFGSSASIRNCKLQGNSGPAIHNSGNIGGDSGGRASLLVENSTLSGNSVNDYGAGIYSNSNGGRTSTTVNNCTFSSNTSTTTSRGGAYHEAAASGNGTATFSNCTFSGNSAVGNGAAVSVTASSGILSHTFNKCIFTSNTASLNGGAYSLTGAGSRSVDLAFTNCTFSNNTSSLNGGAFSMWGTSNAAIDATFTNNTFYNNTATNGGSAIHYSNTITPTNPLLLRNSILWQNTNEILIGGSATVTLSYSLINGASTPPGATNDNSLFNTDPLFVNAAGGNLRLQNCSPAINSGTSTGAPSTDLDNNPRPAQGGFDMGAYESQTSGGSTTYYRDQDGDGFGNPSITQAACAQPSGYVTNNTDCDDTDALEKPGQTWYKDSDSDGYAQTGAATITQCLRPTGYRVVTELLATSGDCNDNDAAIKPGATEICDGIDNNCDGTIDGPSVCPNYTITNSAGAIVITDVAGNGETLNVSQNGANIRFDVTGRTYSLNGGATLNFPTDVALAGASSITINAAVGADIINVAAFSANLPSLTINGGTGDDQVNINGDITFANNANLDVDLQNDDANPGTDQVTFTNSANLVLSGTGAAVIKVSRNINFSNGTASLETTNGNLTLEANQQATATTGNFVGIAVSGATVRVNGTGILTVKGKSGNDSATNQFGVLVQNGGLISGGTSGTATIQGSVGAASANGNIGVYVTGTNARISSLGGNVSVVGSGGSTGASSTCRGVAVNTNGIITAGGSGTVTVSGTGGAGSGNFNAGVYVAGSTSTFITSSGGNVSVTGIGGGTGSGNNNYGVWMELGGQITAGGSGSVTVQGTGGTTTGNNNYGILIDNANTQIASGGGNVSVTGQGGGSGGSTLNIGVFVQNAAKITAISTGAVSVSGTGGNATGGSNHGVYVTMNNAQITSSGGNVSVSGQGGGTSTGDSNIGVFVLTSGLISSGGTGVVTVNGTGASTSGNSNYGVYVNANSRIGSTNANINITAQGGGSGTSLGNHGLVVFSTAQVIAGGIGNVTIQANGGVGTGGSNFGLNVQDAGTLISSSGGNVTINAIGGGTGAGGNNHGANVTTSAQVSAGGSGTVSVSGQGGGGTGGSNFGIRIASSGTQITSSGGNITMTGIEGSGSSGVGISHTLSAALTTATNGGNITLIANSMNLASTVSTQPGGTTVLRQYTNTTQINLGTATDGIGGPLGLSDTELDNITTGTLIIGNANSGNLTVLAAISRPNNANVQLVSGSDVLISAGGFNTGGGTLLLDPGTSPAAVKPTFNGTDVTASTLSFASDLSIAINGITAGDGTGSTYTQLNVAGAVNLTGVDLLFTGAYIPTGSETFTIVVNDGTDAIMGTFTGLAEGATISNFRGSGLNATISYVGGSGNDVVITVITLAAPEMNIKGNGFSILDGDASPRTADGTDFGNIDIFSTTPVIHTFTIQNTGTANLVIPTGGITKSGSPDFGIGTVFLPFTIAPGDSATFPVIIDASGNGLRTATISIQSNDADESPYTFDVRAVGVSPEINVTGLGQNINSGDTTPSTLDDTDFGSVDVNTSTVSHTFTIQNTGGTGGDLYLNAGAITIIGTHASDFTISSITLPNTVSPGQSVTFVVTFDPSVVGTRNATIRIANNDLGESTYSFAVTGVGITPDYTITTTGNVLTITDVAGNGETLDIAQNGANIRFNVTGRTYSINGAAATAFTTPADVALAGITSIVVNTATGSDIINVGAFTANLPSLSINGGVGNDEVYFGGDITFATNANLDVDLQNDDATPGTDACSVGFGVNVVLSGTGTATIKVSKNLFIDRDASIETQNGNLTLEANQQTTSSTGFFLGISLRPGALVRSVNGNITLAGRSGTSSANIQHGIENLGAIVSTTGTGNILLLGTGGPAGEDNDGVRNEGIISATGSGDIQIRGFSSTILASEAFANQPGASVTTASGDIAIEGDLVFLDLTSSISAGTNKVTIVPTTSGRIIDLGTDDTATQLGLTDAELDRITAGTLIIGSATSGTITVSQSITRPASTNVQLISNGDVLISGGGFNTAGGTLLLDPGTSPAAVKPTFNGTDVTASTLSFASDLQITINGSTLGNGVGSTYTQLKVVGAVNLTGVDLLFDGTYIPVGGNIFTIVDNDGADAIIGTFTGLAEGTIINNFRGSGLNATISYTGGSNNNDVVLTVVSNIVCYADTDGDGYGDPSNSITFSGSCATGFVSNNTDCDDNDPLEKPGQIWYADVDNDGYSSGTTLTQCLRPVGYKVAAELTATTGDCNDNNFAIKPSATEICDGIDNNCNGSTDEGVTTTYYADADNDGFGNPAVSQQTCSQPSGYVTNNTDCDDNDALEKPGQIWYQDVDGDGYSSGTSAVQCLRPTGYKTASELIATSGDCNDNLNSINPGATEICDGIDNNCNGTTDEGGLTTYYRDQDGDSFGNPVVSQEACSQPSGYVTNNTDCDDNDVLEKPGQVWYADVDNDGYSSGTTLTQCLRPVGYKVAAELTATSGDCNDNNFAIKPSATEICDGIDNNCNGTTDEGVTTTYYADADNDGFGNPAVSQQACSQPSGYVTNNTDCDDNDVLEKPGQVWYADVDNDGYSSGTTLTQCLRPVGYKVAAELTATSGDCNDNNFAIKPGATEICDGIDNNCNGSTDEGVTTTYYADADNDGFGNPAVSQQACSQPSGYVTNNTDCDDNDALEKPGQIWYADVDNDGYSSGTTLTQCLRPVGYKVASELTATSGDCNDNNFAIKPGATEICDGIDNNCNGSTDEGVTTTYYADADNDGFGNPALSQQACSQPSGYVTNNTDCDDNDALEKPGQIWYADIDNDGYSSGSTLTQCLRPVGYKVASELTATSGDCNDNNFAIKPGATEICDGIDNNCNGSTDEGGLTTYYADADNDGFGNPAVSQQACSQPAGYVTNNTDCDDNDALEKPGQIWYADVDNDGYSSGTTLTQCLRPVGYKVASELTATSGDCNDNNFAIKPGATEICDGIDNNCNGSTDEGGLTTYYADADNDGFGNPAVSQQACSQPSGYVTNNIDCDDNDALEKPGQVWYADVDGDGYSGGTTLTQCLRPVDYKVASELTATSGDCNDNNNAINPGATEVCDGVDNNCDGVTDEGCTPPMVSIHDPCTCMNNSPLIENGTTTNVGTFSETVEIQSPSGQTWTIVSVTGLYSDVNATTAYTAGATIPETGAGTGVFELFGYHRDGQGYTISVTNGDTTLSIGNTCYYPDPVFTGLPALISPNAAPFTVTGTVANNAAGTGTFILDGNTQAGASAAPTKLTINPATLSVGTHTLVYSFDAGAPGAADPNDPGCVQQVQQRFRVAHCGCQDVTVSLNENCQFLLTGNLVSDVNCGGGTVRVMDNDPSNGALIDCAGVWTYGLFDAFGNIICWGKVTAEDKTAPALVCAPADITLDCYDVNYVLNNRLTIGNTNATSSPRPAATSPQTINNAEGVAGTGDNCQLGLAPPSLVNDNIKNLGYAYFKDNCYNCGCRITLKWSDKVEFYSCEQMKVNGGYYALISREWTATDCNGMRSSYVQKIKFTRPAVDDFVFNGAGEGKYDRVVEYNSCTPDKSLIKKEDVTPYVCSYFNTSANPRCLFIDQVECNYLISIKDTEFPICGGKGVKIDRELYVLDWCAGGIVDTFHILIKIGDFQAPTVEYAHGAPYDISTGPMDCTAAIPVTVAGIKTAFGVTIKDNCNLGNISVSVYTKDRYVKGILVYEGPEDPLCEDRCLLCGQKGELRGDHDGYQLGSCDKDKICWDKVDYAVMNGMMIGLPVGKHLMVIDAFDGCYNASTTCFVFEVKDKIAPIMKCDDDLHVTLSNANGYTNGYAQVSAADIDEGSWDNCKLSWIAVRRNVPDGCAASFIQKGYDTNGNGKLDALPADGDVSKADGFDLNGDGDIADFGETFILKGGKLMTPMLDFVEFFCCDLTERVTVELWGGDIYGNTNYCWNDLLIEDKVAPTCLAPWDVTIYCDDKNIAQIDDKFASAKIFGDVTIPTGNDCAALDTAYSTEKKLKCGAGYIDRIWTLTKQTVKGPISVTCKQRIHILPVHEYNICFPKDVSTDCKTPIIDTVITDELGCDILAVNVHDKRYDASDDECYKIFRTYSVINWCTYDDRCGDPLLQTNISIIDRAVFGNYGKAPIYVLVRDREDNRRDGIEEFYISKDLIHNNADDIRFTPAYCEVAGEFYHSFIYTQIIKVYDDTRPVVTGTRDTFCTSPTACTANITKVVTLKDNCTDKVELETQFLMIAPFQTLEAGKMILYSTPRWSTKDLGNGQFEIKVSNLPEGTHDLIVVGRDECGNLSLPTRIPFVVKDCKAPAPICINGLSTGIMPDGNGGGMMAVWASDFVASKIYDCNGQGPETKDGLKLVTKYSINRVGSPVNKDQTGLNFTCTDINNSPILVELHAWDDAGNHDFCITFVELIDSRGVCPGSASGVNIAGTISTEGNANLQGASITLSGAASQNATTAANGGYSFVNLSKGGDFTVTPQLDKNHLNGVSTFDLVLIQKHILGVQALNSPYKLIAADANNSKTISTLDLIALRKLILNIDTHFANNTSWRFVDASYVFPNPTNPWSAAFPEVVSINDIAANMTANFVAIKVGDVNASASVNGAASAEIRTSEDFKLNTQEQNLKSGNEYKVSFNAEDLKNIQGYQFALSLDQSKVELLDIEYGVAKAENFGVFKNEGIITTSWNSKYEPGALFTLVLRAKADAKLSQSLSLNRLVHPEAYDQQNENLGIALNFEGIQATEAYELRQNTPNPFSDETLIGFTLPKAMKGTLTVRDVKGALIYKVEGNYAKGNNQVTLKKEHLGASGVLYYTLETTDFTATKKMVILE